jgi:GAF domain-containing protein/HAMP domain-containing protein
MPVNAARRLFAFGRIREGNLRARLTLNFVLVAVIPLLITGIVVGYLSYSAQAPQALETQNQIAKRVAEQVKNFINQREQELLSLVNVGNLDALNFDEQTGLLGNLLSSQNLYDELILVRGDGQEIIYLSRLDVITSAQLSSRAGKDEFERPKATGQTYYGPVLFNEVNGQPYQVISIPVQDLRSGKLNFVLIANFRFKTVWDIMAEADVVGNGVVYMVDSSNQVIAHANPSIALQRIQASLPSVDAFTTGLDGQRVALAREDVVFNEQTFSVIAEQPQSEALALAINNLTITGIIILIAVAGASIIGAVIARLITNPIDALAESAGQLSGGNLSVQVAIERKDEIGALATAFNSMAAQLRSLVGSLEQRVEERTHELAGRTSQLEAIADLARSIATIQDADSLLPEITRQVSERFGFYHVGIFLLDKNRQFAILRAANSEGGQKMLARGHRLGIGQQGIVGYVAYRGQARVALDVGDEAVFFNNPDLPDTRSEVSLPLRFGQEIIGVLDIQSLESNAFSEDDVELFSVLADQISVAIQNAQSLNKAQHALQEADLATRQLTGQAWREFVRGVAVKGFYFDGSGSKPLKETMKISEKGSLKIPVRIHGQEIASLVLEPSDPDGQWSEDEIAMAQAAAERAALALENARLLEDAQRRAAKERAIGEISTKISAQSDIDELLKTAALELNRTLPGTEIAIQFGKEETE